jgi:hypothetical protein
MKLFIFLLTIVGAYGFFLMHTTDEVLGQTKQLSESYKNAETYAQSVGRGAQ